MCKASRGGLKDTSLDALIFKTLEQVRIRSKLDPALVDDVCLGNVRDSKAAYYIRAAALAAGFPNTAGAQHVARFCSSGLTATQHIANEIANGMIDIGIAVGAESLSDGNERLSRPFVEEILNGHPDAKDCLLPMGMTKDSKH
jgi:acetyl-CoA acyltransferase 1